MLAKLAGLLSGKVTLQGECGDPKCACGFKEVCGFNIDTGRKECHCVRI
ncbi:hypothetical protein [Cytobacillus sp. IB215665]|nr:hypothetical protein [Cytobacillus sp. IB215665]MDX8365388.1 hypothetical protein [Cytobacillus sp. IB215665]